MGRILVVDGGGDAANTAALVAACADLHVPDGFQVEVVSVTREEYEAAEGAECDALTELLAADRYGGLLELARRGGVELRAEPRTYQCGPQDVEDFSATLAFLERRRTHPTTARELRRAERGRRGRR